MQRNALFLAQESLFVLSRRRRVQVGGELPFFVHQRSGLVSVQGDQFHASYPPQKSIKVGWEYCILYNKSVKVPSMLPLSRFLLHFRRLWFFWPSPRILRPSTGSDSPVVSMQLRRGRNRMPRNIRWYQYFSIRTGEMSYWSSRQQGISALDLE